MAALILDAGPLVTLGDRRDPRKGEIERLLEREIGEVVIPAPVTTEVDYLLGQRLGAPVRRAFLDDLAAGRFRVECLEPHEYQAVFDLDRRYADLDLGLADLSIVVISHRLGTRRIATFDERHFRAVRSLDGERFTLLPRDASP